MSARYRPEYRRFQGREPTKECPFSYGNEMFGSVDAEILYSLVIEMAPCWTRLDHVCPSVRVSEEVAHGEQNVLE